MARADVKEARESEEPDGFAAGQSDDWRSSRTLPPPTESEAELDLRSAITQFPPMEDAAEVDYRSASTRPPSASTGNDLPPAEGRAAAPASPTRQATAAAVEPQQNLLDQGTNIGKYEIIRELGRGGMGAVFLGRDTRLGRLVAIKVVINRVSATLNERIIAEARATAQCNHENIVVIYEADEYLGAPYMVLEYLEGKTFRKLLSEQRATAISSSPDALPQVLQVGRAIELMVPVVRALERAHELGIVHRDLKPENIMLTQSGVVKVLDFGIAMTVTDRPAAANSTQERAQPLVGTMPYMSPEQLNGAALDARADLWAVGIMLFEMVTGRHPLAPLSLRKYQQITQLDRPMPRANELSGAVGRLGLIIDRCLIKRRDDRTSSASALLSELEQLLPSTRGVALSEDDSPFNGLAAFQESDAERFFGRTADIAEVVTRVRSQPLVAVVGPSGVGKSSLVRAGVIPALKRSGEGWDSFTVRPGRTPLAGLAGLLATLVNTVTHTDSVHTASTYAMTDQYEADDEFSEADDPSSKHDMLLHRLRAEPGHLGAELRAWAQRKLRRVVVLVDQFEELYTLKTPEDERRAFLSCLTGIADDASSPLRVVLSMRSDFLERMAEDRAFMSDVTRGLVFLAPMGKQGLRDALIMPVESIRYRFESTDIVAGMVDALATTAGALPLLQFAATSLWHNRDRRQRLLTRASYEAMGGIAGTLAKHADEVLASMPPGRVATTRMVFERLVTPERTRAIASLAELRELPGDGDDIDQVVQSLADARLLIVETSGSEGSSVEIVHESLITSWPTLRRWLDENQDDAAFLARLRTSAQEWRKSGHRAGMLWRDEAAKEARLWYQRFNRELPRLEKRYLHAVLALSRRARRRKRFVILGIIGLSLLAALASSIGFVTVSRARDRAERQRVRAVSAQEQAEARETKALGAERQASAARERAEADRNEAQKEQKRLTSIKEKLEQRSRALEGDTRRLKREKRRQAVKFAHERRRLRKENSRLERERSSLQDHTAELEEDKRALQERTERLKQAAERLRTEKDQHERRLRDFGVKKIDIVPGEKQ